MLISVVIDCVVVLSSGLTPLQCTTVDLTKLAKLFLSDPSQSFNSQAVIIVITSHLPDYSIVKVRGGWPARLDTPDFVLQVRAEH